MCALEYRSYSNVTLNYNVRGSDDTTSNARNRQSRDE